MRRGKSINISRYSLTKGYIISVISVILATFCVRFLVSQNILEKAYTGLFYLLIVATMASLFGTRPALLASALSFLLWNFFFFTPLYSFIIHEPREWFLLFVFLVIAIMVGHITGRLRTREGEAIAREKDTMALYKAILSINSQIKYEKILQKLVDEILMNTQAQGCAILKLKKDGNNFEVLSSGGNVKKMKEDRFTQIARHSIKSCKAVGLTFPGNFSASQDIVWPSSLSHDEVISSSCNESDVYIPMHRGEKIVGLMYAVPEEGKFFTRTAARLLVAFASNATILLERQRLLEEETRAKALRESENLRSVLFSSLSHNLKTPIASLNVTLSSLCQEDVKWDKESFKEQLNIMSEDIEKLTENIEKLLGLAQLESGAWKPQKDLVELREIVSSAVSRLPEEQYKRLVINIADNMPLVPVDSVQISQVIRHLTENALVYSYENSRVFIEGVYEEDKIIFHVDDEGPGISSAEKENIFRKFFRGQVAEKKSIRGTGLGLAICKEIVQAHNGIIRLEESPKGGARFTVILPSEQKGEIEND